MKHVIKISKTKTKANKKQVPKSLMGSMYKRCDVFIFNLLFVFVLFFFDEGKVL